VGSGDELAYAVSRLVDRGVDRVQPTRPWAAETYTEWMRRPKTRHAVTATVAALMLVAAGCGGQGDNGDGGGFEGFGDGRPDPAGTNCPMSSHCYAKAIIAPSCGSSCLTGFQTQISFSSNVQRGDGYMTQEFWLLGFGCFCWIETGWLVSATNQTPVMFWAQQTGDGTEYATLATARYVGTLGDADGPSGRFYVVRGSDGRFQIRVDTARVAYRATTSNPMWDDRGYGYVEMGMELVASTGAASPFTFFSGNRYWTAPPATEYVGAWAAISDTDDPPFAAWLLPPQSQSDQGGVYYTQCCLTLTASRAGVRNTSAGDDKRPQPPPLLDETLFDRAGTEPEGAPALDVSTTGQTPAFDSEVLGAWMASATLGVPYDGEVTSTPAVTCPLTVIEADKLLPEPTGLADDRLICLAQAHGRFTTNAPVSPQLEQPEPLTADTAYIVVDATTGNLLVAGAYRRG
jgi:hypothetical protein